jgi:hypothetical protein
MMHNCDARDISLSDMALQLRIIEEHIAGLIALLEVKIEVYGPDAPAEFVRPLHYVRVYRASEDNVPFMRIERQTRELEALLDQNYPSLSIRVRNAILRCVSHGIRDTKANVRYWFEGWNDKALDAFLRRGLEFGVGFSIALPEFEVEVKARNFGAKSYAELQAAVFAHSTTEA